MRVPPMVSDFFEWRWAPCVGLSAGSLGFVALALLLIPTRIDAGPAATSSDLSNASAMLDRPTTASPPRALFGAALPRDFAGANHVSDPAPAPPRPRVKPSEAPANVARGFSPIIDRPEPPAPPPPPPPTMAAEAAPAPPPPPATPPPPASAAPPPPASPDGAPVVIQQPDGPDGPRREITVQ